MRRVTEFRVEQAERVLPLARDANDERVILACKRVMVGWLEGLHVDATDMRLVDAFDPTELKEQALLRYHRGG
jgi:hypothetical protein